MIYTIGNTKNYTKFFIEQGTPQKAGRTSDYPGGSVWKTPEEALKHCPENFSVYGVDAIWETDTVPNENGDWHDLLIDADLVKVDL